MFVFDCCLAFSQMLFACSLVFNIIFFYINNESRKKTVRYLDRNKERLS